MRRMSLIALMVLSFCVACGDDKKREVDTPAGHPDELKDSTRLDPAPQPGDTTTSSSGQTAQPKKKYRFSS